MKNEMASSSKGSSKKRGRAGGAGAASSSAENEGNDVKDTLRIKITSMGEGGVGKSCLIKRYCEENAEKGKVSCALNYWA